MYVFGLSRYPIDASIVTIFIFESFNQYSSLYYIIVLYRIKSSSHYRSMLTMQMSLLVQIDLLLFRRVQNLLVKMQARL